MQLFFGGSFLLLLVLLLFIWVWWTVPPREVPEGITDNELKRLETRDKLRQTIGQSFAGIVLVATFALTIYQTFQSTRQWTSDYELKQWTEALKAIAAEKNTTARVAGLYALHDLAKNNVDAYEKQVIDILVTHVRGLAQTSIVRPSKECNASDPSAFDAREDADPEVQAVMNLLGDFAGEVKPSAAQSAFHLGLLRLDHLYLDDLDLGDTNFSYALMSQSWFGRVSFRNATLVHTDFGGSHLADYQNPGFPTVGTANWLYWNENKGGEYEWRRYRCWVADFRRAHLEGAIFSGAGLTGADFREATFDAETSLKGANIGRANFKGAVGLSREQLEEACADEPVLSDLEAQVKACPGHGAS